MEESQIEIDGSLNKPEWKIAKVVSGFTLVGDPMPQDYAKMIHDEQPACPKAEIRFLTKFMSTYKLIKSWSRL
ncbi:MAG: hypothetical protein AAGI25_19120 [Bacteroidota bacterium]